MSGREKTLRTGIGDEAAKPKVNIETCTACGACAEVCKTGLVLKEGEVLFAPRKKIFNSHL